MQMSPNILIIFLNKNIPLGGKSYMTVNAWSAKEVTDKVLNKETYLF